MSLERAYDNLLAEKHTLLARITELETKLADERKQALEDAAEYIASVRGGIVSKRTLWMMADGIRKLKEER